MHPILIYSEDIENRLTQLDEKAKFVFGAAICNRVWPTFLIALRQEGRKAESVLEEKLRAVWSYLAGLSERPLHISPAFEQEIPSGESDTRHDQLFACALLLFGFSEMFDRGTASDVEQLSSESLSLLDDFVYNLMDAEVSDENDVVVGNHPLVVLEFERQKTDLGDLVHGASRDVVLKIWNRSRWQSVLGGNE